MCIRLTSNGIFGRGPVTASPCLLVFRPGEKGGIYRLTVPEGQWTKLSGLEGVNGLGDDSQMSLTPEGQPAIMTRTGVAQIYLLHWEH